MLVGALGTIGAAPSASAATTSVLKACNLLRANTTTNTLQNGPYVLTVYSESVELRQAVPLFGSRGADTYYAMPTWTRYNPNDYQTSTDKTYLALHCNGDLALRRANGTLLWHANTANRGITQLTLSPYGNLLLQNAAGTVIWQSATTRSALGPNMTLPSKGVLISTDYLPERSTRYTLTMEANGNLVYRAGSTVKWQSRTYVAGSIAGFSPTAHLFVRSPSGKLLWVSPGTSGTSYSAFDLGGAGIIQVYPKLTWLWGLPA